MIEVLLPAMIGFGILLFIGLFIFLDNPKPHNWRELGQYSLLFKSSLKSDNYPSEKEVFQTLKDAGVEPCFLGNDLSATENAHITIPVYSDKDYRDMIVKPRTIWAMNRHNKKQKPIDF